MFLAAAATAAPAVEAAAVPGANLQRPSWSPDGSQLAFEANFHDRQAVELHVGPPQGGAARVMPPSRAASPLTEGFTTTTDVGGVVHELSWSPPSMGRFVYAASTSATDYDLYVQGGGPIATSPATDGGAAWSPDGRWIAFTSARSGEGDLYLVDVHAIEKAPRRLTWAGSSELYAAWAPDSARLAFVGHSDTGDNVWLLPSLDAEAVQLTTWAGNQIHPTWSPTADQVAFYANHEDPARFDLYVARPQPGAEPRLLARGVVVDGGGPSFTPDGQHLIFVADDDARLDPLSAVAVGGGTPRVVDLGTVGNGDLDVVARGGTVWIAWVAQGRRDDPVRDFKKLYVSELPTL